MMREKCLICENKELKQIIDLGMHPFADTFIPKSKVGEGDVLYPLICDLCTSCGHIQTKYETDPELRYSQVDYSYTSSNSSLSRKHWEDYAMEVSAKTTLKPNSLIVEIGSNDGYLSEQFIKKGHKAVGIDPSPYMADLAKERNVPTIGELFGEKASEKVLSEYGKADLIIANNVFNHSDNPLEFIKAVANLLGPGGSFSFEQPYWLIGLKSGKFDQVYHEHVSYFTVRSVAALLEKAGMGIKNVEVVDYHGGSLRIIAQKKEDLKEKSEEAKKMIDEENNYGTFDIKTYKNFMKENLNQRNKFLQKVYKIKEEGKSIIAVGAAAKGNTFLNFYNLDHSVIDYVTDASPHKKGKYTPATGIPIVGDEIFSEYRKVYDLILSWNIANLLKEKLKVFNKEIEFLVPEEM